MCETLRSYVSSSSGLRSQSTTSTRRKDAHDPEYEIKQGQRIRYQATHATHPSHGAKHPRGTVRAPPHGGGGQEVPEHGVHGDQDSDETSQHERQETVPQHAG